ncbi:MAG TPA: ABC transporter permease [Puia sp.]|nr:ABC transporter permease [Puia sp.]
MRYKFFQLTFRHVLKQKGFTLINLIGLTAGLTSCILIGLFIADELSFDSFHSNGDRIVRITMEYAFGGTSGDYALTGTKAGPQFKRTFPEVESFTRTFVYPTILSYDDEHFTEKRFLYADSSFFTVFSFPLISGDPHSLRNPSNIVLTASSAKKYFGNTDVIGKTLRVNDSKDYTVSAIAADPPRNSQLQFDCVVGFSNLDASRDEQWMTANYVTYLLLHDRNGIGPLQKQIDDYMRRPEVQKEAGFEGSGYLRYYLEPLKKVHLYSRLAGFEPNGNITYVVVLLLIAVLILVIAAVNYTNLAIAQSSARTGEIGIRKVLGALKSQLIAQFAGESLFITLVALLLSVLSAVLLLPFFNEMTGKYLVVTDVLQIRTLAIILAAGLVIGLLAGAYPALVLANTRLISILRSGSRITGGQAGLRRTLIVLQFVISLFLIITTVVILQQMSYIRHKDLGMDRDHVIVLPIDSHIHNRYEALKTAVKALPGVVSVSGSYNLPISATWGDGLTAMTDHGKVNFPITAIPADLNYLATMNMQLLAGSDFTQADLPANNLAKDSTKPALRYILNETAVRKLGWTPQQAIGKVVDRSEKGIVKGVVRDFHFASMHEAIGPLVLFADTQWVHNMLIRVNSANLALTIDGLRLAWKTYVPSRAFDYHFLDDDYNRLYTVEQRTAGLFTVFASLAILLACLGLFGLAAISTVQRTREIGIRKVLGANVFNICLLMSNGFLRLVIVAIVIAAPIAWWAASQWLQGFAYRIPIRVWIFPMAGALAILLAFMTVSFHAVRAGNAKPADSLRTE